MSTMPEKGWRWELRALCIFTCAAWLADRLGYLPARCRAALVWQVMFAEPLGTRPMGRGSSGDMLLADDPSGAGDTGSFLPASAGPSTSAEENVAAAAAAAAVAGMHHSFMTSPQEATCSTSMQLHTPMTGTEACRRGAVMWGVLFLVCGILLAHWDTITAQHASCPCSCSCSCC